MKLHAGQQGTFLYIHTASVSTALCSFKIPVLNLHSNIKLMAAAYSSFIKITIRTLVIDSVILAAYGTSLRGIAQKCSVGLTGACSPLYQQELKKKFVSSGSDPVHAGSEASVHYSSCSSGSHGNWVVGWANTQQTGDQRFFLFLHAHCLIPASFLVTYQLPQHCFLSQSPLTVAAKHALCHTHAHFLLFTVSSYVCTEWLLYTIDLSLFILHAHVSCPYCAVHFMFLLYMS